MKVLITNTFKRTTKKLYSNQIAIVEEAIEKISIKPDIGELKLGDLAGVRVYKFHIQHQLMLLAYIYYEVKQEITLLALASHANFYQDLKNQINAKNIKLGSDTPN